MAHVDRHPGQLALPIQGQAAQILPILLPESIEPFVMIAARYRDAARANHIDHAVGIGSAPD